MPEENIKKQSNNSTDPKDKENSEGRGGALGQEKKLDKETEKLRTAVLKVISKYPDENHSVVKDKKNRRKRGKKVYSHKDVATLGMDQDVSVINKLLEKKPSKVKIKKGSKLGSHIENLNNLLLKKSKTEEKIKEIISPSAKATDDKEKKDDKSVFVIEDIKEVPKKNKVHHKDIINAKGREGALGQDKRLKNNKKFNPPKIKEKKQYSKKVFILDKSELLLFVLNLAITIVLLGGIMLAVVGISIYRDGFLSDEATTGIATVIPYPAGIVNSKVLIIAELRRDVAAMNRYFSVQSEEDGFFGNFPSGDNDVQSIVWDRFVQDTLLFELADEYGLVVTPAMLQEQLDAIVEESGTQLNFENRIAVLYGWDVETFTQRVIKPFVLREVVAAKIFRDQDLRHARIDLANQIANELSRHPDDFAELAIAYSEDELTRVNGGETGLLTFRTLADTLNEAIVSLDINEVSGVIESGEGYEIIQVLEKIGTQVNIRRILIRYPTLELLLDQARQRATIYRFVR